MNSSLETMLDCGFERDQSELALQIADGNVEIAINLAATNTVE